jgi:hypothetical protein
MRNARVSESTDSRKARLRRIQQGEKGVSLPSARRPSLLYANQIPVVETDRDSSCLPEEGAHALRRGDEAARCVSYEDEHRLPGHFAAASRKQDVAVPGSEGFVRRPVGIFRIEVLCAYEVRHEAAVRLEESDVERDDG